MRVIRYMTTGFCVVLLMALMLLIWKPVAWAQNTAPVKAVPYAMPENFPYEEIEATMPDLLLLRGRLYDPSQKPKAAQADDTTTAPSDDQSVAPPTEASNVTKYPLVILLHGLNGSKEDWGNFPAVLVKKGYAVLALDLRGHGESNTTERGGHVAWRTLSGKQWNELPLDVERVLRYFAEDQEYPQVDTHRVAIIGAKLGANVGVIAASHIPDAVKALVLLSSGVTYKGLDISRPIVTYPNALFVVASQGDNYSFDSSKLLYHWAVGVKKLQLYRQIGDGTDMLRHLSTLSEDIITWLGQTFPPTPLYPPGKAPSRPSPVVKTPAKAKPGQSAGKKP